MTEYLIRKSGAWYRPNSAGYTNNIAEAGRYTLAEAIAITHPNGPDGPRDNMSYEPAPYSPSSSVDEVALPTGCKMDSPSRYASDLDCDKCGLGEGDACREYHTIADASIAAKRAAASLVSPPKAGTGEPVAWRKPKHPAAVNPFFIDAEDRTADWAKQIYTVPLYANPEPRGDGIKVTGTGEADYWAVWSGKTGVHIGLWPKKETAEAVASEYSMASAYIEPLYRRVTDDDGEADTQAEQSAENMRLIDWIADQIGLPHDEELSRSNFAAWREAALPPIGDSRAEIVEALEAARDLAKTMEGLTGCRSDDDYVWGAQAKIEAALASIEQGETKP